MKIQVATINVIEVLDNQVIGIVSYPNTTRGNLAAKRLFRKLYREHNDPDGTTDSVRPSRKDFDAMFEYGYDDECGYTITLIPSLFYSV
jgi:hypothetical protein